MGFDHAAWPLGQGQGAELGGDHARLDWNGLRARFLAVRAFRQAAADGARGDSEVTDACFDRSAARVLADFAEASHGVNQRDSANGKDASGNNENVADASTRGDRG